MNLGSPLPRTHRHLLARAPSLCSLSSVIKRTIKCNHTLSPSEPIKLNWISLAAGVNSVKLLGTFWSVHTELAFWSAQWIWTDTHRTPPGNLNGTVNLIGGSRWRMMLNQCFAAPVARITSVFSTNSGCEMGNTLWRGGIGAQTPRHNGDQTRTLALYQPLTWGLLLLSFWGWRLLSWHDPVYVVVELLKVE